MLDMQCVPSVRMKDAQAMNAYMGMTIHRAKTPNESGKLIAEMEQRVTIVAEITESEVEIRHAKSVLAGIVDVETVKHCAQYIKDGDDATELQY